MLVLSHIKYIIQCNTVQYTLIEHSKFIEMHSKQTYSSIVNTLIVLSSNKIFTPMLFILEHNTSIMGSMKSIVGKSLGNSQKSLGEYLSILTEA